MVIPENIKVLIFDLDGTLYNLVIDWAQLKRKLADLGDGEIKTISDMLDGLGEADLEKARMLLREAELAGVEAGAPCPGVVEALKDLSSRYRIAILTRNAVDAAKTALHKMDLDPDRVLIVGRESVEQNKPHPAGIEMISQGLGADSSEVLMIGDTFHDVEAARAAGVRSVIVANAALAYQPEGADGYIASIAELTTDY